MRRAGDRFQSFPGLGEYEIQGLAVRMLENRGHQVAVAADGREAVSMALAGSFDVILMDVHMPVMDGFEATHQIREAERVPGRHVPIIALTACAMAGDREKCLRAGMDGYTDKPISRAKLLQVVEGIVEKGRPPTAAETSSELARR